MGKTPEVIDGATYRKFVKIRGKHLSLESFHIDDNKAGQLVLGVKITLRSKPAHLEPESVQTTA